MQRPLAAEVLHLHPAHVAFGRAEVEPAHPRAAGGGAHALGAVHVVAAALLRVAQGLVGDRDLLEAGLGGRVAVVGVGVVLAGEAAVGLLDLVVGRVPADAEHLVEVGGHQCDSAWR